MTSNLFEEDVFKDSNRSLNGTSSIFSCSCLIELSVLFIASVPIWIMAFPSILNNLKRLTKNTDEYIAKTLVIT